MLKRSLGLKIMVLAVVVFSIFAYADFRASKKQILLDSQHTAEVLSTAIRKGLDDAMIEGKRDEVQRMVESYRAIGEIDGIRIFNPESGSILVDADKNNIGKVIDPSHISLLDVTPCSYGKIGDDSRPVISFIRDNDRVISLVTPILNAARCYQCHDPQERILGALDIDVSIVDTSAYIASNRSRIIRFTLMSVASIALVIALIVVCFVRRPVRELTNTMRKVESGDLSAQAHVGNSTEFGKLAESFNSMTVKLRENIEKLEALRKTAAKLKDTLDPDEREYITIQGITQGLGFERAALLLVNQEEQTLEGRLGMGIPMEIIQEVRIPLRRGCGILAEAVLSAQTFNVRDGVYDMSLVPVRVVRCWEVHQCSQFGCSVYGSDDLRCWFQIRTYCYSGVQNSLEDKLLVCHQCPVLQEAYGENAALVLMMFGSKAFAAVPLMARDKVAGVVMADNLHSGKRITDEDVKGLSILAAQAGMAIENAKLYRKMGNSIELANEELRQKIATLTEMKNLNDSILQNMSNGLITIDMEGEIVYLNSAAEAILGYETQDMQGRPVEELFKDLKPLISRILREREDHIFHETEVTTKAGISIPVEVSTSLLRDGTNEITGVIMIFTDLTERKKMEEQIRRADRLATLGQLAAGLAHEIRNPLAGISGAVQILRDDIPESDSSRDIFNEIVERIKTLDNAIGSFLRFARPAPLQLSPTDINEVVESVSFLVSKQAEAQGITIVKEYDSGLPTVMVDPEQLQQVIINMVLNALQAIGERDGRILFKTYNTNASKQVVIQISDTGIGIPAEALNQVFDPYFTTKTEGTGLGLSIAQRIIEEHGGNISVESEVGKGTTFRVSLRYG